MGVDSRRFSDCQQVVVFVGDEVFQGAENSWFPGLLSRRVAGLTGGAIEVVALGLLKGRNEFADEQRVDSGDSVCLPWDPVQGRGVFAVPSETAILFLI